MFLLNKNASQIALSLVSFHGSEKLFWNFFQCYFFCGTRELSKVLILPLSMASLVICWLQSCLFFLNFRNRRGVFEEKQDLDSVSAVHMTFSLLKFGSHIFHLQRRGENTSYSSLYTLYLYEINAVICYIYGSVLVPLEEKHLTFWRLHTYYF
jgi:hypothetical protein